jgi:ech hydrogenase subunit F
MSMFRMAKTLIKNLFIKPSTKMYPIRKREFYNNTRGSISIDIQDCIFCGLCQKKCPSSAIEVTRENKRWEISRWKCVTCGACVDVCPKKCLYMRNQYSGAFTKKSKEVFEQNARVPGSKTNP